MQSYWTRKKNIFCIARKTSYLRLLCTSHMHAKHSTSFSGGGCVMRDVDDPLLTLASNLKGGGGLALYLPASKYTTTSTTASLLPALMSFLVSRFSRSSRVQNAWFLAGLTSSYPNLDDEMRVSERRLCGGNFVPGCRVFHVPLDDSSKATEIAIDDWKDPDLGGNAKDQVMVFQYKGKFVAVNHVGGNNVRLVSVLTTTCAGMPAFFISSFQRCAF